MEKSKSKKKSSHLENLERSFDRQARRFSAFEMLGLQQGETKPSESSKPIGEDTSCEQATVQATPPVREAGDVPPTPVRSSPDVPLAASALSGHSESLPNIAEQVYEVPLARLVPSPDQPRHTEDPEADQELLESIRQYGVLTPIHVRPVGNGFEVIAGERRWRACKLLGKETIPALIRPSSNNEAAAQALIDNLMRKDLSPLEEARAFQALIERHGYRQTELADQVGCHKSRISVALSILKLPASLLDLLFSSGTGMTVRHVQALLPLLDKPAVLDRIARQAVKEGWTSEQIRAQVSRKPRVNSGAQAVRFHVRGEHAERGFLLQIRFHPNRPYDVPMIEEALSRANALIRKSAADDGMNKPFHSS